MDFKKLHRLCSNTVPDCGMYLHEMGCQGELLRRLHRGPHTITFSTETSVENSEK
jgi:hypothetical protein